MRNNQPHSRKKGFSLIELMLTAVGILVLSAVSYKVIRTQNIFQISAIEENQRANVAKTALDRFKRDAAKIDPNWVKLGVPSVFPHPGYSGAYGAQQKNYYIGDTDKPLSDAVTFLMTREDRIGTYGVLQNLHDPAPTSDEDVDVVLYSTSDADDFIDINPGDVKNWDSSFQKGDWVLVYQKGKYALGVVSKVQILEPSYLRIKLAYPDNATTQLTYHDTSDISTGIVTQPGVVIGSYDYLAAGGLGHITGNNYQDNSISFSRDKTFMQVVQPVSYAIEPLTENGGPAKWGNSTLTDKNGEIQFVVTRAEYHYVENDGGELVPDTKYESLAKMTELGFTYDIMVSENNAGNQTLSGYLAGDIARDVGRKSDSTPIGFISLDQENIENATNTFIATSNIVGVRMMIANRWKERDKVLVAENDVKISLDPTFRDIQFQESQFMEAKGTPDIIESANLGPTQHIGMPLYFKGPNSQEGYILLPIMDLANGTTAGPGKLVFLDRSGQPVSGNHSSVTIGDSNNQFYPTQVKTIQRDGRTFIVVTGMGIQTLNEVDVRKPMMATIDISSGDDLVDRLDGAGNNGTKCSMEGCKLHVMDVQAQNTSLKDTVNGFIEYKGDLYMSSLTKDNSELNSVKLYKTNVNVSGNSVSIDSFQEVNLLNEVSYPAAYTSSDRVISAIGNKVISYGDNDYLPVCMSRRIAACTIEPYEEGTPPPPCSHIPKEDGAVYLYDMAGAQQPIKVASHNYLCTALQTVGDNLLVGGRLVTQIIHEGTLTDILDGVITQGSSGFPKFYTDEVFNSNTGQYADAYFPLSVNFPEMMVHGNGMPPRPFAKAITWNSGTMVELFNDGRLGIALGNRTIPAAGADLDAQGVITMDMDPGGMKDRVFSNIRTHLANLNTSEVSNIYHQGQSIFSTDVVLPGILYGGNQEQGETIRTSPMILPLLANPNEPPMSEGAWKNFFLDYFDPADRKNGTEYNVVYPASGPPSTVCGPYSMPSSCSFN